MSSSFPADMTGNYLNLVDVFVFPTDMTGNYLNERKFRRIENPLLQVKCKTNNDENKLDDER